MMTLTNKIPNMPPQFGAKVGFINAPLDIVALELQSWLSELKFEPMRRDLAKGIEDNAHLLLPLATYPYRREILVATSNPQWTAYFDGYVNGGEVTSATSVLAKRLGVARVTVLAKPFQEKSYLPDNPMGGLIFEYTPDGDYQKNRSIALVEGESSSSRYHFEMFGEVQPWEDVERYEAKYKRDRLTPELIDRYCRHLGINVFDLSFYSGPSVFFERTKFST